MGSFIERAKHLEDQVGNGDLVMRAVVSQPYAAAEHNRSYYRHPRGGASRYLEIPFLIKHTEMIQKLANNAVTPNGSRLKEVSHEVAKEFDHMVRDNAPVEFTALRNSTNVYVEDDGMTIYFSPQTAPYQSHKD